MLVVRRLLNDEGSLYGYAPSRIATLLAERLNEIESSHLKISGIVALPDYHDFFGDGGVKDIFILCEDVPHEAHTWYVTPISGDHSTMHGNNTADIADKLQNAILSARSPVQFVVALTDTHDFVKSSGEDGLKTFLLCY